MRDLKDAHVLDTAFAAKTDLLVTANFDDFIMAKTRVVEDGKVAVVETASGRLVLAHPFKAAGWLNHPMSLAWRRLFFQCS